MGDPITFPVAVIEMARPLPGILGSPDALWEALLRGDSAGSDCKFFGMGEHRSGVSRAVDY